MKHILAAVLLGLFGLSGVSWATGTGPTEVVGFGVSATDTPQPQFFWTAPFSGAESYDLNVQRLSTRTWRAFKTASVEGDAASYIFQGTGDDFRSGVYRAMIRAKTPFWIGPWTTWVVFTNTVDSMDRSIAPVLIVPMVTTSFHRPLFGWKGVPNADKYKVTIQSVHSTVLNYTTYVGADDFSPFPFSETVGVGNSYQMSFGGALSHQPIMAGSLTIGGMLEPLADVEIFSDRDKDGLLYSTVPGNTVVGFINYYTGAFAVQFFRPVMTNTSVTATYIAP
jgi:hypothetical protein